MTRLSMVSYVIYLQRFNVMFAAFHELFTFFQESKAKNQKKKHFFSLLSLTGAQAFHQKLLEFVKIGNISSSFSRTIKAFILKRSVIKVSGPKNHVHFIFFNILGARN